MILKRITIANFRGILNPVTVNFTNFNCIIGQNDAGKSTILKALDAFLNETTLNRADYNTMAGGEPIVIELYLDCENREFYLGEEILTTIESEELTNSEDLLVIKKSWSVTDSNVGKPKISILRKKYTDGNDIVFKNEKELIAQCKTNNIITSKGNGEDFNNVEKREKLRAFNKSNDIKFTYENEEVPSSGTSKIKTIGDAIKKTLPSFQYFKADTSLSDSDNTIQKYFKDLAFRIINEKTDTDELENTVKVQLESVLEKVTNKINEVVKSSEKVEPKITFDWSKLITTSFVSTSSGNNIPLSSRGDGFRRITMMSYFEYLAESQNIESDNPILFGFEEPETFLHPSAQDNLFDKLSMLADNGYQVIVSSHSPIIVANAKRENIIHISKTNNDYTVNQSNIDYKEVGKDLGIKEDTTFAPLFSKSRLLFLVEGIDDVNAMHHNAELYKSEGHILSTFKDLHINIIPIGGCDSIKHWIHLDLLTKLGKPFFVFLDSDKDHLSADSKNKANLESFGFVDGIDFLITKKRLLENYIHPTALERLVPGSTVTYGDFDHAKNFCKDYPDDNLRARLGGKSVASKHYSSLNFEDLRKTWYNGTDDEFINIHNALQAKLNLN